MDLINLIDNHDKIDLKSKNVEKLKRFSAFSTKSEKIRANLIQISKSRDEIWNNCKRFSISNFENAKNISRNFAEILRSERCKSK